MARNKINAFCLDHSGKWAFAATISGQILSIDLDRFEIVHRTEAHSGTINVIKTHPLFPILGALGEDRRITLWKYTEDGRVLPLLNFSNREFQPENDAEGFNPHQSTSQAFSFHSTELRVVSRAGNSSILEFTFDLEGNYSILRCIVLNKEHDISTTHYLPNSNQYFAATVRGHVYLAEDNQVLHEWRLSEETSHWFEHYKNREFLVASDSRSVFKINLEKPEDVKKGVAFARDDFEHIHYQPKTGKIFASSFDRNIYEIDPQTLNATQIVFRSPFKCRWIATLPSKPNQMIVQCRNGALYLIDTLDGKILNQIKETPDALWTAVGIEKTKEILMAGEGNYAIKIKQTESVVEHFDLPADKNSYTKRMAIQERTGLIALGRTDGQICLISEGGKPELLLQLSSAVRDLDFHPNEPILFAALEDGRVLKIDCLNQSILCERLYFNPVWAIAYNSKKNLLAISERMGELLILNGENLEVTFATTDNRFSKRMKWLDDHRLLYGFSSAIHVLDLKTCTTEIFLPQSGNSIEDFVWDDSKTYLISINYNRDLILQDIPSKRVLSKVPDQLDYSKGILFLGKKLNPNGSPHQFITFGRCGVPHLYQIQDEKILALGPYNGNH
jgi:WD40 repeat protein